MLRLRNPFASLLRADGSINPGAVMARAWARYRSMPGKPRRFSRGLFGQLLREAWGNARQGVRNALADAAHAAREAREAEARAVVPAFVPVLGALTVSVGSIDYRHLMSDGR